MSEILIPPQNLDAERAILGAILIDEKSINKIKGMLVPSDFYRQIHGEIFKIMLDLSEQREPIDVVTVGDKFADKAFLVQLITETVTAANIGYHSKLVKDASQLRELSALGRELQNNDLSVDEALAKTRNKLQQLVRGSGAEIMSTKDIAKDVLKFVENRAGNRNSLSGISSGFSNIDKLTDGWQRGDLIIPAARPSIGKSAFALTLAENAGVPVGVISLEMGPSQLGIRSLASLSGVELWRLRKGIVSRESWDNIHSAIVRMGEKDIFFSFTARNAQEIERVIFQMVELHGIQLLILDYLQLVQGADRKRSREQEVAEISRMLKNAAQIHNIPVIALAQLNREVEKRENKRHLLSDLRDSGQIEQDADVIIFLYDDEKNPEILNLHFAKGRNIGLGAVQFHFNKDLMRFKEVSKK